MRAPVRRRQGLRCRHIPGRRDGPRVLRRGHDDSLPRSGAPRRRGGRAAGAPAAACLTLALGLRLYFDGCRVLALRHRRVAARARGVLHGPRPGCGVDRAGALRRLDGELLGPGRGTRDLGVRHRVLGRLRAKALRQLAVVAASFVAGGALVYAATGFSLRECFAVARFQNVALMTRVIGRDPAAPVRKDRLRQPRGLCDRRRAGAGLGPRLAPAGLRVKARPWTAATARDFGIMTFGGFYTMETERIWSTPFPGSRSSRFGATVRCAALRVLLAAGWAQSLGDGGSFFTLW